MTEINNKIFSKTIILLRLTVGDEDTVILCYIMWSLDGASCIRGAAVVSRLCTRHSVRYYINFNIFYVQVHLGFHSLPFYICISQRC